MGASRLATNKSSRRADRDVRPAKFRKWLWLLVAGLVLMATAVYAFRTPITGYANAGTAYTARVTCSCVFVAGRSLDDCTKDKLGGTELISLSADEDAKSVTARFPLIRSDTAIYRKGYGCVLQEWQD